MKLLTPSWLVLLIGAVLLILLCIKLLFIPRLQILSLVNKTDKNLLQWHVPDTAQIAKTKEGELIKYGRELITHTSVFLGPKGKVAKISNGMNCQNCHIAGGTVAFGNSFFAVASTYPKYRDRSGQIESVEFRVNECLERSLNGKKLDSLSREMKAMVAYFEWLGKDVPKGTKPKGTGTEELSFLNRPANPLKGKKIFVSMCERCHGKNGEGVLSADSVSFTYPPLWGDKSYTVSAGMYRLTKLAGFIRNNMPLFTTVNKPLLSVEESWAVGRAQEHGCGYCFAG